MYLLHVSGTHIECDSARGLRQQINKLCLGQPITIQYISINGFKKIDAVSVDSKGNLTYTRTGSPYSIPAVKKQRLRLSSFHANSPL